VQTEEPLSEIELKQEGEIEELAKQIFGLEVG
jgi:hypothetical protein